MDSARRDMPISTEKGAAVNRPQVSRQSPDKPIEEKQLEIQQKILGTKQKQPFTRQLEGLFDNPKNTLMELSTFFPFDLFPDTITINPLMIRIVYKQFFATEEVKTVLIKDITDVTAETALFLATLKIIDRKDPKNPIVIQ